MKKQVQKKQDLRGYTDFELAMELLARYQKTMRVPSVHVKNIESKHIPGNITGRNVIIQPNSHQYPIHFFFAEDGILYYIDIDTPHKKNPIPVCSDQTWEHMLVPALIINKSSLQAPSQSLASEGQKMI